jgi:DNA-binding MarR family transcriptional regulator
MSNRQSRGGWTLLSNHGKVLSCITADPTIRVREMAARCGITERAAHRIVADLERAGLVSHVRVGRRNRYEIHDQTGVPQTSDNPPGPEMLTSRRTRSTDIGGPP